MEKDNELCNVMATSLIQYRQSLALAKQYHEDDIAKFCEKQIVFYTSGLYNSAHFNNVVQTLESMKEKTSLEDAPYVEQSLTDLYAEYHASQLTSYGKMSDIQDQDQMESAFAALKDSTDFIPIEYVKPVAKNLETKMEMQDMYSQQMPAISNALMALTECRYNDLICEGPVQ